MKCTSVLIACLLIQFLALSQGIINRMKQKAIEAGERAIEKPSGNTSGRPANTTVGGLVTTPPDVRQNIADAETAYRNGNYSEARYAVRQAMLGVEMEIGNKVLKSLPEVVQGLKVVSSEDRVTSTGFGWVGLTIHRAYEQANKYLTIDIANNAALLVGVNAYLTSGAYAQQSSDQQNWKQTKVKGYRAVIEYDESSGYKISIPIGQTSIVIIEGSNFTSEQEITNAAQAFDLDGIKAKLGEK